MSRSGSSLADWQDIYNGVNERRKAVMFTSGHDDAYDLEPVPFSENHITHGNANSLVTCLPLGQFCDPFTPLTFQTWNDQSDTGSQPNGINSLDDGIPMNICRYVPQFGSVPVSWSPLAGSGWFLDWIDGALGYMTKAAAGPMAPSCVRHVASLQWYQSTGEVWDNIIGDYVPGLVISSYSDLWNYATQNLHEISGYSYIDAQISTSQMDVNISYSAWEVPHPGVIPADLTLYYSATGQNLGYTPTNYPQSGGPYVHGYATLTKQAASAASPLSIGFTSSVIPSNLPAPGYYVREELSNFYGVWDFAPYLQN